MLIPPSVVDGKPYVDISVDGELAALPSWLPATVHKVTDKREAPAGFEMDRPAYISQAIADLEQLVKIGDVAVQGTGANGQSYELAQHLMDLGVSPEKSAALMLEHWYPHCRPNNKPSFIGRMVEHAARYRHNAIGCDAPAPAAEAFKESPAVSEIIEETRKALWADLGLEAVNLGDVAEEALEWHWPQRFPKARLSLLSGFPGEGKTTILIDIIARTTTGKDWPDGSPCPKGHVIYLASEDGLADTIKPRVMAAGGDCSKVSCVQAAKLEGGGNRTFDLQRIWISLRRLQRRLETWH